MSKIDKLIKTGTINMPTVKRAVEAFDLPINRDLLHKDLMDNLRLNRYDTRFMSNIYTKYISQAKPLSQGQNDLYEKIIHKYRKQLRKIGIPYREIIELKWDQGIVDLDTLTQKTYFRVDVDGTMRLYFNFNKTQIDQVRSLVHDDEGNHLNRGVDTSSNFGNGQKYDFTWDNRNKVWFGQFNIYLFKALCDFCTGHNIQIEATAQALVNALNASGDEAQWTPSIHISNGRLYVSHITETMLPFLDDLDLTDLSVKNIERLTRLGLKAPAELSHIAQYVDSTSPTVMHDITDAADVATLKQYLEESGRKAIFYEAPRTRSFGRTLPPSTTEVLNANTFNDWNDIVVPWTDDNSIEAFDSLKFKGYNTLITTVPYARLFRSQERVGQFALEADKVIYLHIINDNSNNTNS